MQRGDFPYKNIGERLRRWRQRVHESIAEVSGAVEIDTEQLKKIENGIELPSEDILLLLISHLDVDEKDARTIYEQAGYAKSLNESGGTSISGMSSMDEQIIKQTLMVIPFDNRILYSDSVNIAATPNGVVFDFLQTTANPQPATVGRIGMSLEHAQRMQKLLTEILSKTGKPQRLLEPPKN
jgi:transcriptional regulator with XRE-family HTH domain